MDQERTTWIVLGGMFIAGVAARLIWAYIVYGDPLCALTTCVRVLP